MNMNIIFFFTFTYWSWTRFKKGEFVEDKSYEWSDVELDRRLGVRVHEQYFPSERFDTNREHNYWIEKAGGWRIKFPFCKTHEETRLQLDSG